MRDDFGVTLQEVYEARQRIRAITIETPLIESPALAETCAGRSVFLKAESLQPTGSFKIRGAANKLLSLTEAERARGVVTVSSGNHGRAVAHVAAQLGIRAVVCLSERTPRNKIEAIAGLGAEVLVHGASYEEAEIHARRIQEARGLTMIEPFDDPFVIAGQGTVGLEILAAFPAVDTLVVPLSGGGLLSGIALVMKSANPAIRTVGVSMARAPVMYHSLRAGEPVDMAEEDTLADALVGNIGLDNRYTFRMIHHLVDEVVLVSEEEIAGAMAMALQAHRLVVEGGGAVAIAASMHHRVERLGRNVVVVVSGSNVSLPLFLQIARDHGLG